MILLDTDHLSVLQVRSSDRRTRLVARMALCDDTIGTTIVGVEEQMRGWLVSIAKEKSVTRQVTSYRELGRLFEFFEGFEIAPFDDRAAARWEELRKSKIRLDTMDLKIASIALVNNATLLTANRRHFEKVPGLKFENWMDAPPEQAGE